jgi:hypothetical protein
LSIGEGIYTLDDLCDIPEFLTSSETSLDGQWYMPLRSSNSSILATMIAVAFFWAVSKVGTEMSMEVF